MRDSIDNSRNKDANGGGHLSWGAVRAFFENGIRTVLSSSNLHNAFRNIIDVKEVTLRGFTQVPPSKQVG